jgi:phosphotransacetylase
VRGDQFGVLCVLGPQPGPGQGLATEEAQVAVLVDRVARLALDLAVSPAAAETKGVSGPAAGRADILVVPDVAAGNIFAKSIMYFSNCPTGGLVVGTNKAVTFSSRSDSADTKFHTLALGVLMS